MQPDRAEAPPVNPKKLVSSWVRTLCKSVPFSASLLSRIVTVAVKPEPAARRAARCRSRSDRHALRQTYSGVDSSCAPSSLGTSGHGLLTRVCRRSE